MRSSIRTFCSSEKNLENSSSVTASRFAHQWKIDWKKPTSWTPFILNTVLKLARSLALAGEPSLPRQLPEGWQRNIANAHQWYRTVLRKLARVECLLPLSEYAGRMDCIGVFSKIICDVQHNLTNQGYRCNRAVNQSSRPQWAADLCWHNSLKTPQNFQPMALDQGSAYLALRCAARKNGRESSSIMPVTPVVFYVDSVAELHSHPENFIMLAWIDGVSSHRCQNLDEISAQQCWTDKYTLLVDLTDATESGSILRCMTCVPNPGKIVRIYRSAFGTTQLPPEKYVLRRQYQSYWLLKTTWQNSYSSAWSAKENFPPNLQLRWKALVSYYHVQPDRGLRFSRKWIPQLCNLFSN